MSDARKPNTRHPSDQHPVSRRRLSRLGGSMLVVVLLVAIVASQHTLPDADRKYRPLATKGDVGEVVRTPDFRIEVDKVDVARSLTQPVGALGSNEDPTTTQGVWVIVWARATSEREPRFFDTPQGVELVTRNDRHYAATSLSGLTRTELEPGLWKYGPIVFEIPRNRLAGADLLITTEPRSSLNSQAHISLGLDEAEARRLVKSAPAAYALMDVRYI